MASQTLATELIGRTTEIEDRADAHRWRAYYRYFDLASGSRPLAFHWLLFSGLPVETRTDGHAVAMPPFPEMPFPRRMWAGGEVCWHTEIMPDETLHRRSTVSSADAKQGSTGDFLLASLTHEIVAGDALRVAERQDIVFLTATTRPGTAPLRPVPFVPDWEEERTFDAVDLFRYSALTLNSHRIHYDLSYARDEEHYFGIVVHGPLLASALVHAGSRRIGDRVPSRFRYRANAPSIAGEPLSIVGTEAEDGTLALAIAGADGDLRMTGSMTFEAKP